MIIRSDKQTKLILMSQEEELSKKGNLNIRWSQSRCGYVIFAGRNYTNLPSFESRVDAQSYIDTLNSQLN